MNLDYLSHTPIQLFISQIHELLEFQMIVSKRKLRRQINREKAGAVFTSQFIYKAVVTRRTICDVLSNSYQFVFC